MYVMRRIIIVVVAVAAACAPAPGGAPALPQQAATAGARQAELAGLLTATASAATQQAHQTQQVRQQVATGTADALALAALQARATQEAFSLALDAQLAADRATSTTRAAATQAADAWRERATDLAVLDRVVAATATALAADTARVTTRATWEPRLWLAWQLTGWGFAAGLALVLVGLGYEAIRRARNTSILAHTPAGPVAFGRYGPYMLLPNPDADVTDSDDEREQQSADYWRRWQWRRAILQFAHIGDSLGGFAIRALTEAGIVSDADWRRITGWLEMRGIFEQDPAGTRWAEGWDRERLGRVLNSPMTEYPFPPGPAPRIARPRSSEG